MVNTRTIICLGFSTISMLDRNRFDAPSHPSRSPAALLNETTDIKSPAGTSGTLSEQLPVGAPSAPSSCGSAIATGVGKVDGCLELSRERSLCCRLWTFCFVPPGFSQKTQAAGSMSNVGSSGPIRAGWTVDGREFGAANSESVGLSCKSQQALRAM